MSSAGTRGLPIRLDGVVMAVSFVACAVAAVMVWRAHGYVVDDAFITYRYARNLADGSGWTYNPGVATLDAASAPLYTMLLAGLATVGTPIVTGAKVVAVLSLGGTAACWFAALRRLHSPLAGIANALLIVTSPWLLSMLGMETLLLLFLVSAAFAAWTWDAPAVTGALFAAAVLVRPDAACFAVAVVVASTVRERRVPWPMIAGGAAVAVAGAALILILGGDLLPNTLDAKQAQGASGLWGTGYVFLRMLPRDLALWRWYEVTLAAAVVGVAVCLRRPALGWVLFPLIAGVLLQLAIYGLIIRPPAYIWYYGPAALVLLVVAGVGLGGVADLLIATRFRLAVVVLAVAVGVLAFGGIRDQHHGNYAVGYVVAGRWLLDHTAPNATVAASEIGYLGYYSRREMVDYLGLLDQRSIEEVRRTDFRTWLGRTHPDWWVVHDPAWYFETPALGLTWFPCAYERATNADAAIRAYGLVLYHRVRSVAAAKRLARAGGPCAHVTAEGAVATVPGRAPAAKE